MDPAILLSFADAALDQLPHFEVRMETQSSETLEHKVELGRRVVGNLEYWPWLIIYKIPPCFVESNEGFMMGDAHLYP